MQRLAHCVWEAKGQIAVAGSRDSLRITAIISYGHQLAFKVRVVAFGLPVIS